MGFSLGVISWVAPGDSTERGGERVSSTPVKYHDGMFPPKNLDWERLAMPIERATNALARYDSFLGIIPDSSILVSPMLVQEAVTSSRIEGTHATVSDVLVYEAGGGDFTPSQSDDVLEVVNYRYALSVAEEMMKKLPLSGRVLKEAHFHLLQNVRGKSKSPGKYRTDQNWIGKSDYIEEARYIPVGADKLDSAMADWERYVNDDGIPALVKVSVAHAEFESIHPFRDGNGRIGRMIVPLMLSSNGVITHPCFYLSEFFEHRNDEYQDRLLAVSSDNEWTEWCIFFLNAIETQAVENDAKAKQIYGLYKEVLLEAMSSTKSGGVEEAVNCLFRSAIFSANTFTKRAGMNETASRRLIATLKKSGRIVEIQPHRGRTPALLAFPELLEITEGIKIT